MASSRKEIIVMDIAIPDLDSVGSQFMNLERSKKLKILVVDDEPDNLDLLYRTFRRDFQVLRAESGIRALEVLAVEGEVAVIISDQRMPEMKGTEFLSKTVPQFPDTIRIILTGFTDVEDLVDAINTGQVYKFITKPWDPSELKMVVQQAAANYDLLKQRAEELTRVHAQTRLLNTILQVTRHATDLDSLLTSIAAALGKTYAADGCIVQMLKGNALGGGQGLYSSGDSSEASLQNWLADDRLVQQAIATHTPQVSLNVPTDAALAQIAHYGDHAVQAHLVLPILFQQQGLAILSLQWKQPHILREDELASLRLVTQQVALAIICAQE
jgi:CheY-like chemotaxis protein